MERHGSWSCLILVIGSLCFIVTIPWALFASIPSNDNIAFDPLAWSPDGRHLSFGVQENEGISTTLFVVNADGHQVHKLIDTEKQPALGGNLILEIRWGKDAHTIYFSVGNSYFDPNPISYAIEIDGEALRPVPTAEFLRLEASNSEHFDSSSPVCGKPAYIQTYASFTSGLIAQSACTHLRDGGDCLQKLQVCNIVTGKKCFELNEAILLSPFHRRFRTATVTITLISGAAVAIGVLRSAIVVVLGVWNIGKNKVRAAGPG